MRTAAKRDTPERECIREAQRLNAEVFQVSGAGLLDTLVAYKGALWWVEVKRPGEPLKLKQEKVLLRLHLQDVAAYVVERPEDMRALIEGRLSPWSPGVRHVEGVRTKPHRPGVDKARSVAEMCTAPGCTMSRVEGSHGCEKHPGENAEVLPAPRKRTQP